MEVMDRAEGFTDSQHSFLPLGNHQITGPGVFRCWKFKARCHNRCPEVFDSLSELPADFDP